MNTRPAPPDVEERRRAAPDGPTEDPDDMRMDVHLDQIQIPASTKLAAGALVTVLAGLVTWNLIETIANGKQQRDDKREVWIELGKQQAKQDVTDVRLQSLESRVDKIEERK